MIWRRAGLTALTIALAIALAGRAGAQQGERRNTRPWHEALRLRALVRSGAAQAADSFQLAAAELELGRPEAAAELTAALALSLPSDLGVVVVAAGAADGLRRYEAAADWYSRAAALATGSEAGVLHARAAGAHERAGRAARAAAHYGEARRQLPTIAAWLAVREARVVSSTVRAYELLRLAPAPAREIAQEVRAERLLRAADTTRAIRAFVDAGLVVSAARLAWTHQDTATARALAFRALATGSVADIRVVERELAPVLAASRPMHDFIHAAAHRRVGEGEEAVRAMRRVLRATRPGARVYRLLGDAYAEAGQFEEADRAYAGAAAYGGTEGGTAAFRRAMLGGRSRDRAGYRAALLEFAERFPAHEAASRAVWLAAEDYREAGHQAVATDLYRRLDSEWPESPMAARARLALAEQSRRAGDGAGAEAWYQRELDLRGAERHVAAYLLASLQQARGATAEARASWAALAEADPWGYHGAMARRALGWTLPSLDPEPSTMPTEMPTDRLRLKLAVLDRLVDCGLDREAGLALASLLAREDLTVDERVALAEGLIARGWTEEGVRLGWQVTRDRPLGDPAVLRVIFPWPYRDLIEREATEHGVDPHLLAALIRQESTFRPHVTSPAGARGMMQLMPSTAAWLAERRRLEWDERLLGVPEVNVHLGAAHLASLLTTFGGDELAALAAYNAGGRPTRRWRQRAAGAGPFEFVRSITYTETRGYVQAVVRNRDLYRALYAPTERAVEP